MDSVKRDSFVLHTEILDTLAELTDQQAGKLFKAIVEYAATGKEPELKGIVKVSFAPVKRMMDYNTKRYEEVKARRSEAGRKGAEARWNSKAMASDSKAMASDGKAMTNDSITDNCKLKTVTDTVSVFPTGIKNSAAGCDGIQTTAEQRQANLAAIRDRARKVGTRR